MKRWEGEELVSNAASQASQLGWQTQGWEEALVLQVLEEEEELLSNQEEVAVVVDLTYLQVEEVEAVVHLYLEKAEEVEVTWRSRTEVEGVVGVGCFEEEVEEVKEETSYLVEEEGVLDHQEEEEVEGGLLHQQNPLLDLSLLHPSGSVEPARKSRIRRCGVLACSMLRFPSTAFDLPPDTPRDLLLPPERVFS